MVKSKKVNRESVVGKTFENLSEKEMSDTQGAGLDTSIKLLESSVFCGFTAVIGNHITNKIIKK